jgi:putative two-component system response regulator
MPGRATAGSARTAGRVLIVDDEPAVASVIERALRPLGHRCAVAHTVAEARAALAAERFDLVLCDIRMDGESGLDLLAEVSRQLLDTAVVMVTGVDDPAVARQAALLGVYGYLVKPFTPNEIQITVEGALHRRALERARRAHVDELEAKLVDRAASLREAFARIEEAKESASSARRETAERLTLALTLRDEETGRHIERVGMLSVMLAERAGVSRWRAEDLQMAAMLHDVGKIGVPDSVLLKPGRLSEEEQAVVQRHPEIGRRLLERASSAALRLGASVAMSHHERWDGSGYPLGLAGDAIPLEGRITAVADAFDALTSNRVYRPAHSIDAAAEVMVAGRGSHFDPDLLDMFTSHLEEAAAIKADLADPDQAEGVVRVLVVAQSGMFAETLVNVLGRADGIVVVSTAPSVAGAVEACRRLSPDVLVSEWSLPDGTAASVAWQVREYGLGASVVALVDELSEDVLLALVDAGCPGWVEKRRALDDLVAAIRAVSGGHTVVHPQHLSSLLHRLRPRLGAAAVELSTWEQDVLALMAEGLSPEAIAERLELAAETVRSHVGRLVEKLGARSPLEAVGIALRSGLIPPR